MRTILALSADPISQGEREVLAAFASHITRSRTTIMRIGEVLGDTAGAGRSHRREALRRLIERGWLMTASPLDLHDSDDCALLGDGLRTALQMIDDRGDCNDEQDPGRRE